MICVCNGVVCLLWKLYMPYTNQEPITAPVRTDTVRPLILLSMQPTIQGETIQTNIYLVGSYYTMEPVYSGHPWDHAIYLATVGRWLL